MSINEYFLRKAAQTNLSLPDNDDKKKFYSLHMSLDLTKRVIVSMILMKLLNFTAKHPK